MNNVEILAGSIILGAAAAFMTVQILIFIGSIIISVIGLAKERKFNSRYFFVWLKSITGIAACVIVISLGDYIFRTMLGFTYEILDMFIFWSIMALTLLGFIMHVARRIKRAYDLVSTPEFDVFHAAPTDSQSIDDYVKKNLELLRLLQEGEER